MMGKVMSGNGDKDEKLFSVIKLKETRRDASRHVLIRDTFVRLSVVRHLPVSRSYKLYPRVV